MLARQKRLEGLRRSPKRRQLQLSSSAAHAWYLACPFQCFAVRAFDISPLSNLDHQIIDIVSCGVIVESSHALILPHSKS